jgi:predicted RNA-binding protein with PIN domain
MIEHRKAELTRFITEEMKGIWVTPYLEKIEADPDAYKEAIRQTLGVIISQYCEWTGHKIVCVFLAALEDSNYHTFGREVNALWNAANPAFKIE